MMKPIKDNIIIGIFLILGTLFALYIGYSCLLESIKYSDCDGLDNAVLPDALGKPLKLIIIKPLTGLIGVRINILLRHKNYLTADFILVVFQIINPPVRFR